MYQVEIYGRIRRAVLVEGRSQRSVARECGLACVTVRKMLGYSIQPGYRRKEPARRPKLGPWVGVIDAILEEDNQRPAKQRHTAKRIFDGAKVFVELDDRYKFVLNIPNGDLANPQNPNVLGASNIFGTLPTILSARYEDGLLPVELAHSVASLSTYPSAKVLTMFDLG